MEFIDLSKLITVKNPKILPFSQLRKMKPIWITQELILDDDPNNLSYAQLLADEGHEVVPIRKRPPTTQYLHRDTFPRRVIVEMTSRCNFLCRMCPQQNLQRPRMDMDGELYRKIIDELDTHGIEGLWLYHLGESLMHPEFTKNIEHISTKKNLGYIWLSTNGQFFDEKAIKCILNSNISYINYSAHAVTEKTYKKVSPWGDFNIVQGNLEKFYDRKGIQTPPQKPYLHCQMIEQEITKHEVDAFIKKHYKKADIVSVNMLEYANLPNNKFGLKQRKRTPLSSCLRVSRNDCFVMSDGHVTLCDAAYNHEIDLGNITTQSLYEIWNGAERKRILKLNAEKRMADIEFCRKCTDYDI